MSQNQRMDPYNDILGIPPAEQPPTYYRLLGLVLFERDSEKIHQAVRLRTKLVSAHRKASTAKVCDRLLEMINAAKTCLLDARLKAAYDRKLVLLREKMGPSNGDEAATARQAPAPPDKKTPANGRVPQPILDDGVAPDSPSTPPKTQLQDSPGEMETPVGGPVRARTAESPQTQPHAIESALRVAMTRQGVVAQDNRTGPVAASAGVHEPGEPPHRNGQSLASPAAASVSRMDGVEAPASTSAPAVSVLEPNDAALWLPEDAGYEIVAAPELRLHSVGDPPAPSGNLATPGLLTRAWKGLQRIIFTLTMLAMVSLAALVVWVGYAAPESSSLLWDLVTSSTVDNSAPPVRPRRGVVRPNDSSSSLPGGAAGVATLRGVELGIVCGPEKLAWLEEAAAEFSNSPEGRSVRIQLMPMESDPALRAILGSDSRIDAWTPASGVLEHKFRREWVARFGGDFEDPIARRELLAFSPFTLLMWRSRLDAISRNGAEISMQTVMQSVCEGDDWAKLAGQPEWGRFKFAHASPIQSNSGLMTLHTIAQNFEKNGDFTSADAFSPAFQQHLVDWGKGVSAVPDSTDRMIRDMILRGPTQYDAVMADESVAISFFEQAAGRWEPLAVIYAETSVWNDNPYYVLHTPWTTPARQQAATAFLDYLMSEPLQRRAVEHGFRPANEEISLEFPESPFIRYESLGIRVRLGAAYLSPAAEVTESLQKTWLRNVRH